MLHLLLRHTERGKRYVVVNSVVKENRLLINVANKCTQITYCHLSNIGTIYGDTPLRNIPKARNQIDQRTFPRSRASHQSYRLPFLNGEIEIGEHSRTSIVPERDILKANLPLKAEFLRLFGVFYWVVHLQDTLNTLHGGKSFLYRINSLAKIFSRVNDVVKDNKIVYENRSRDNTASAQNETSPIPQNDGNSGGS